MNWQDDWREIPALSSPPYDRAVGVYRSEDEIDVHIIRHVEAYPGKYLYTLAYHPDGLWLPVPEMAVIPVYKTYEAQRLINAGLIEALEEGVHVRNPSYDSCARCGYTGQQAHSDKHNMGEELPCLGWTVEPKP